MRTATWRIRTIYRVLLASYGPQDWWPAESPFEVLVGAVLTQNTSWRNVESALERLREAGALASPAALEPLQRDDLEQLIRPAGFHLQKATTLRELTSRVLAVGGLAGLLAKDRPTLRAWLLGVRGIGPETADSIVLYAAGRPAFVVDAYTRRFAARHAIVRASASYDEIQRLFERALPPSACVMNEYHALLVRLGKTCCRPTPTCSACPLRWDRARRRNIGAGRHPRPSS